MFHPMVPPTRLLYRCTTRLALPTVPRPRFASTSSAPSVRLPTIFAPATGKGKSAISILRIGGDDALEVWRRMTRPAPAKGREGRRLERTGGAKLAAGELGMRDPPARRAVLRRIVHPETEEVLDEAVVLYFPGAFFSLSP